MMRARVDFHHLSNMDVPECICPHCKAKLDAVHGQEMPKEGDLSICVYCSTFLVFDKNLKLSILSKKEWNKLDEDTRVALNEAREANNRLRRAKDARFN